MGIPLHQYILKKRLCQQKRDSSTSPSAASSSSIYFRTTPAFSGPEYGRLPPMGGNWHRLLNSRTYHLITGANKRRTIPSHVKCITRSAPECVRMADRSRGTGRCGCVATRCAGRPGRAASVGGSRVSGGRRPAGAAVQSFSPVAPCAAFRQNYHQAAKISARADPDQLAAVFLDLRSQGAYNLNLVTATQYLPDILEARTRSRTAPYPRVVYNCGGMSVWRRLFARWRPLRDDIWLPDFKMFRMKSATPNTQGP